MPRRDGTAEEGSCMIFLHPFRTFSVGEPRKGAHPSWTYLWFADPVFVDSLRSCLNTALRRTIALLGMYDVPLTYLAWVHVSSSNCYHILSSKNLPCWVSPSASAFSCLKSSSVIRGPSDLNHSETMA